MKFQPVSPISNTADAAWNDVKCMILVKKAAAQFGKIVWNIIE